LAKPLTDTVILNDNDNDITWQDYEINEIKINKPISLVVGHRYMLDTSRGTGHISKRRGEYLGKFNDKHYFFQPGLGKLEIPHSEIGKRLVKDITPKEDLDEIKINKPGLNFPIKIETPEQAQKIVQQIKISGIKYYWPDFNREFDNPIKYNQNPFIGKYDPFEPFELIKLDDKNHLDMKYLDNGENDRINLNESIQINPKQYIKLLNKLVEDCCKELEIQKPVIKLINNDKYTNIHKSYGGYFPDTNEIKLVIYGRDCMSSIRSLSHEIFHSYQMQNGLLKPNSGEDGDDEENAANAYSGKTCRWFGRKYPEAFFLRYDNPLNEIKVNKPGLNFPIKIETPEQAQKIGKILNNNNYLWDDGEVIDLDSYPFMKDHFNPFIINKGEYDNTISSKIQPLEYPLYESIQINPKLYVQLLNKLVEDCCKELEIQKPVIKLINNDKYTLENKSYAGYFPSTNEIKVVIYGRNLADSCRSLSHELKHAQQQSKGELTQNAGEDGDTFENEANSFSGKKMREFGRKHPEIYFMKYDKN